MIHHCLFQAVSGSFDTVCSVSDHLTPRGAKTQPERVTQGHVAERPVCFLLGSSPSCLNPPTTICSHHSGHTRPKENQEDDYDKLAILS